MGIRTSICVEDSCIYANDEPYSKIIHEASPCTSPVLTYDNTYKNTQDSTSSSSKPVPITQIIMKPFTSEHNPLARKTEPRTGLLEQHRGNEVNSENGADSVVTTHISSSTEESKKTPPSQLMIPTKQTNKDKYNHMCDNEEDHEQGDFQLYLVVSDEDLELIGDAIICGSIRRLQSMLLKLHRLKTEFDKDLISFSGLRWRSPTTESSPMHLAVLSGNISMLEYVLLMGASVHCRDGDNNTPLSLAYALGYIEMVHSIMRHAALPFVTSPYSPLRSMRSDQRSEHGSDFSSVVSQSKLHDRTRSMSMASDTDSEIVPIETQIPNSNGIAFDHRDSPFLHPNYHRTSLSRGDIPLTLSIDVDMENDQNTVGTSLTSASSMLLPPVRSLRRKLVPKRIRKAASRVLRLVHVTNKSKDMTDSGSDSVRAMTL